MLHGEMAPGSVTLVAVRRADSLKLNRDPSKVREKLCWLALVSAGSGCGAGSYDQATNGHTAGRTHDNTCVVDMCMSVSTHQR